MYAIQRQPLAERAAADPDVLRRIHLGMIDAVLAGGGTQRVAALAARQLDGSVAIVLPAVDVAVIAPAGGDMLLRAARRYVGDDVAGVSVLAPEALAHEVAITSGDERLGSVLLLGRQHTQAEDVLQLAALAAVTSVALEQAPVPSRARARLALLEAVREAPPPHHGEIVARARQLGMDLAAGASALCVRVAETGAEWALATIAQEFPTAIAAQRGDHVEALLPKRPGAAERLARRLRRRLPTGLAPFTRDLGALGSALRFAELAMILGEHEEVAPDELLAGSWRLLLQAAACDAREIDQLIAATIGPAVDADTESAHELVNTLRVYYAHDARMNAAAAAVHAHRHTVGNRLRRVAELTGHDPQTPQGQAQLSLGLQALTLLHATSPVTT